MNETLAYRVSALVCRTIRLEGLAGEILATIKLNAERGYLVAQNDEGKLNLENIVASWSRQLAELQEPDPETEIEKLRAALLPFGVAAGRPGRLLSSMTGKPLPDDVVLGIGVKVSAWKRASELTDGQD